MTESERMVLKWKAALKQIGWPEDQIRSVVSELCEAGYRKCIEDIQARQSAKDALIKRGGELNSDSSGTIKILKSGRYALTIGKRTEYFDPSKAISVGPGVKIIPPVTRKGNPK